MDRKRQKTGSKKNSNKTLGIVLLAVALILGSIALYLYNDYNSRVLTDKERQSIVSAGTFHKGITVNGVSVGGMTIGQAEQALDPVLNEMRSNFSLTLKYEDYACHLSAEKINLLFNTDEVLDEAILEAGEGDIESLRDEIADIELNGREFKINYTLDPVNLREVIGEISGEFNKLPTDASFAVNPDIVTRGTDLKAENLSGTERFVYSEAKDGIKVNEEKLCDEIEKSVRENNFGGITIPVNVIPASVTSDKLKETLVLRGSFHTSFASGSYDRKERVFNITKAAGLLNGMTVIPGEVFSMNGVLGDRTYADGWQPAPAVIEGGAKTEDQPGGGVCQVSTTLYNAVIKSDLEIVFRQAHSMKLGYVGGGLDATIDSGHIDFKWKNSTNSDIYIFSWVDTENERIFCEIYGEPFPDEFDRIEFTSERVDTLEPGADEYEYDETVPYGTVMLLNESKSGSVWKSYVTYFKGDAEVKTVEVAKTAYRAHPNRYVYGPGYVISPDSVPVTEDPGN
jgi:vancomycin resistance protein YoaR